MYASAPSVYTYAWIIISRVVRANRAGLIVTDNFAGSFAR